MRTQSFLAAILTLALVAVLAIGIPHNPGSPYSRVAAASVTPELHFPQGNLTCNDVEGAGQTWTELKVDPNTDGSHTDGTLTVNITHTTFDKVFDWTSNIGVDGVIVKAGSAGTHFYRYDPPGESTGDTGLTSPGAGDQNSISHLAFCYDTNDPTATATNTPVPPSATATDTPTNTPTATATSTDTPTNTPTATSTDTPTNTPTATGTDTPTNTPTATDTPSPTNTPPGDPTATVTPTSTPVTPTATNTLTDEPNATPTDTPVPPTNTATSEPSATATATDPDPGDPTPTNTTPPDPTATNTTPPSDPTATDQPPSDPTATNPPPSDPTATNPPPTDAPPTIIAPTSPPSTPTATVAPVCATNNLPTLTVSAAPAQALPGAEVVYTVRVGNPHAADLTQVSLAASFSGLAEFVSTTATQGQPLHPAGSNSVSLALASLGSGQSVEMTIRVRLAVDAPASSQVNVSAGAAVNGLTCQQASAAVTITPAGIPVTGGGPGWAELRVILMIGLVLIAGSVWASRQMRKRLVRS